MTTRLLLRMLSEAFYTAHRLHKPDERWISHRKLAQITPRYSARFHELRENNTGINVIKRKADNGDYEYALATHPENIDLQNIKLLDERPYRPAPGSGTPQDEGQDNLFNNQTEGSGDA